MGVQSTDATREDTGATEGEDREQKTAGSGSQTPLDHRCPFAILWLAPKLVLAHVQQSL
jgi:hypothetical protein